MDLSNISWANMAKSTGDVVAQVLVQPGIMALQAFSDQSPDTKKKITKNGQVFKQAVKHVITSAALLPKTWGEPSGTTRRLLEESEAPWPIEEIKPVLKISISGKSTELTIRYDETPGQVVETLVNLGLLEARQITFITHGFMTTGKFAWVKKMRDTILRVSENGKNFVVIVDWGGGAFIGPHAYDNAAQNIATVGTWLANHLSLIREVAPSLHVWGVGHSLGAHLLGVAGKTANQWQSNSFDRVTALDPAGPGFENYSNLGLDNKHGQLRLTRESAKFVDVIHTDGYSDPLHTQAIISPTNHYGTLIPLGHVDFYPNWGHSQPGCVYNIIGSHLRSIDFFIWSIENPGHFLTRAELEEPPKYMEPAKSTRHIGTTVEMGYHCRSDGPNGYFYLEIGEDVPWIS